MSLTRQMLKGFQLAEEVQSAIIDAHLETVNALKAERDQYKADAEKLLDIQKQLADAQTALKAAEKDDYKGKYEAEKAAHDKLKTETAEKETRLAKETAMREALKAAGYSDKGISKIIKFGGLAEKVTLGDDGKISNADDFMKAADGEWSEYKGESKTASTPPATPPDDTGSKQADPQLAHAAALAAQYHADRYGAKPEKEG